MVCSNHLCLDLTCFREPKKMQPLKHIHNDSLLCRHGGLLFRPQTIGADEDSDRSGRVDLLQTC